MYIQHPLHPAGYRQVQLTEFVSNIIPPLDAVRVTIQPVGQDIRLRDDSIDPTTTTGLHIAKDSTYVLDSDTKSLRLISEANTNAAEPAIATLASGPVNSDVMFESVDTGPEWNGFHFEIVTDAVAGVNSSATLNSAAVNSDVVFTAPTQDPVWDGYDFTIVKDATLGANATATLNSGPVNSDLTFTAAEKEDKWNAYNFTAVADANAGVNASAVLLSAPANSDLTFTAAEKEDKWNGYNFTSVDDVSAGTYADATLGINVANGDLVFQSPTKSAAHNGIQFVADSGGPGEAVTYNAGIFTLEYNPGVSWGSTMKAVFDAAVLANPAWPQWSCAQEGNGNGAWDVVDDAANATSANGVTAVVAGVTFAGNTFTIHIDGGVTTGTNVSALWAAGPANCANFAIAVQGVGSGLVDATTVASAGGVDILDPYVAYTGPNTFTIHILPTTNGAQVVILWGAGPANCANFAIVAEGNGNGIVGAGTVASAGGIDVSTPHIDYAVNAFTIHTLAAAIGSDVVALWAGGPAECANWTAIDEGDGSGIVQAVTDASSGGTIPVAPSIDFASHTFTIHTIPAVTTANGVVALWAGGPANCADWTVTEEGDGTGVVGADTDTSANGADAVGAVVNLLWHKEI